MSYKNVDGLARKAFHCLRPLLQSDAIYIPWIEEKQEIKFLGLMKISSGRHIITSSVIKWLNESE